MYKTLFFYSVDIWYVINSNNLFHWTSVSLKEYWGTVNTNIKSSEIYWILFLFFFTEWKYEFKNINICFHILHIISLSQLTRAHLWLDIVRSPARSKRRYIDLSSSAWTKLTALLFFLFFSFFFFFMSARLYLLLMKRNVHFLGETTDPWKLTITPFDCHRKPRDLPPVRVFLASEQRRLEALGFSSYFLVVAHEY